MYLSAQGVRTQTPHVFRHKILITVISDWRHTTVVLPPLLLLHRQRDTCCAGSHP
jgi:hypothetical protein